jgi:hypothetical protein
LVFVGSVFEVLSTDQQETNTQGDQGKTNNDQAKYEQNEKTHGISGLFLIKTIRKGNCFLRVYYPELFRIYPRNGLLFPLVADLLAFRTGQSKLPHFPVPAYFRLRKALFPEKNIESEEDKGNNYDSQND